MFDKEIYQIGRNEKAKFKFSYSEFKNIKVCPHRYELESVLKESQVIPVRRLLGPNVLDQALTTWVKDKFSAQLTEVVDQEYSDYVVGKKIPWEGPGDEQQLKAELFQDASRLEQAMRNIGLTEGNIQVQPWLSIGLPLSTGHKLKMTGKLDFLHVDRSEIWDLKRTKNKRWLDRDQLLYYDFGFSHQIGKKIKQTGFLAPMMSEVVQKLPPFRRYDWEQLIKDLEIAVARVDAGEYPALGDYSKDCYMCFMKTKCKVYNPYTYVHKDSSNKLKADL